MSRIGKKPVALPSGVSASVSGQTIEVKGPKGTRSFKATDDVTLKVDDNVVTVTPRGTSKRARQQWGMSRTMVANLVTGVTDGFKKELEKDLGVVGKNNIDAATKVGALIAERAKKAGVEEAYFDRGGFLFHGKVKALADAAREGGLKI